MKMLQDSWFLLWNSFYPGVSALVFFLLGLSLASLLWRRWAKHYRILKRENAALRQAAEVSANKGAGGG